MNTRRVLACAIVLLACSHVFAQDYEIRMTRPTKVGRKYRIVASGSLAQDLTRAVKGEAPRHRKLRLTAKLEGVITVLQVDKFKRENKVKLLVSKCLMSTNGTANMKEALPKGTQVVAQVRGEEDEFLVDGKAVSKEIAKMLGLFISFSGSQTTHDKIYGTKERKKVGDSWAVNRAEAVKDLANQDMTADAKDIKGGTTVKDVVVVDGTKCLLLHIKMQVAKMRLQMPPGLTVKMANVSIDISSAYPVDTAIGVLSDKTTMTMAFVATSTSTPDGPELTLSVKATRSGQTKRVPLN